VYANRRGEEILGLERSSLEHMVYDDPGFRITDTAGESIPSEDLPFARILRTGERVEEFVHRIVTEDGTVRTLSINGSPIYHADGRVDGAVFNLRELS